MKRRFLMSTVVLSSKYEIVIPESLCEQARISPGQKVELFCVGGVIEVVPVENIKSARGSLPGLTTEVERDEDDRV